jgi:Domain of unknown function (DUF4157)
MSSHGRERRALEVTSPGDANEREANRVAASIARDDRSRSGTSTSTSIGSRQALDPGTRALMESRLGRDFRDVSIRTDRSAGAMNARAYTIGSDVVFDEGQYTPDSASGRALIAHELTHVIQQRKEMRPMLQRQVYGPPAETGAGTEFDNFLLQFGALEQGALNDGYSFGDRITAFRKLYYDSPSNVTTYAGAVVGGGFNILIPGAAATKIPPSWSAGMLAGSAAFLKSHEVLTIGGRRLDMGHMLAGADAARHPTKVSIAGGVVTLRSNVEAFTFVGDLGSVVAEYIHGSTASFRNTAMVRSPVLDSYYDGIRGLASAEDMAGNADAYSLALDSSKSLTENLKAYYAATTGGVTKRFTGLATAIGLGTLTGRRFAGDTKVWRDAMRQEVFNSALAYAGLKGWREQVLLVLKDPGPGIFSPTHWEMYWNDRMVRDVGNE